MSTSCVCDKKTVIIIILSMCALASLILTIYGVAAWNNKKITTCTIVSYDVDDGSCYIEYYTPESINCSKPTNVFVDINVCSMLDDYKYENEVIRLPCLISSVYNYKNCPFDDFDDAMTPYFNYISTFTEAQICTIVGGVMIGCLCVILLCYVLCIINDYKTEVAKLMLNINNNYNSVPSTV